MADFTIGFFGSPGKTAVWNSFFKNENYDEYNPNNEDLVRTINIDNRNISISILNVSEQDSSGEMKYSYFSKVQGFVLFYDISEPESLLEVKNLYEDIKYSSDEEYICCIFAELNSELREKEKQENINMIDEIKKISNEFQSPIIEVSAETGKNVDEIIINLINLIKEKMLKKTNKSGTIDLNIGFFGSEGKSAICLRFFKGVFYDEYLADDVNNDFVKTIQVNGQDVNISIMDMSAQDSSGELKYSYFSKVQGFVLFYDVSEPKSFLEVKNLYEDIKNKFDEEDVCCVFAELNSELREKEQQDDFITIEGIGELSIELQCPIIQVSAETGKNVDEIIKNLTRDILDNQYKKKEKANKNKNKKKFKFEFKMWEMFKKKNEAIKAIKKSNDKKSHETDDKKSYETDDEKSHETDDKKLHETDDEKSHKSDAKKLSKFGFCFRRPEILIDIDSDTNEYVIHMSENDKEYLKIGLFGPSQKTEICEKLIHKKLHEGQKINKKIKLPYSTAYIDIIDVPEEDCLNEKKFQYFDQVQGFILFFDIADENSIAMVKQLYLDIKSINKCPFYCVIGCLNSELCRQKQKGPIKKIISDFDIHLLRNELCLQVFKVSAKTGENIFDMFYEITYNIVYKFKNTFSDQVRYVKYFTKVKGDWNIGLVDINDSDATQLAQKFVYGDEYNSINEDELTKFYEIDSKVVELNILVSKFGSDENIFKLAQGIIIVFDINHSNAEFDVEKAYKMAKMQVGKDLICIVAANHCEKYIFNPSRSHSFKYLEEKLKTKILAVSSVTNENIEELFFILLKKYPNIKN